MANRVQPALDKRYFRPTEVENLIGDATKAKNKLGWHPKTSFRELVKEMVNSDFELAKKEMGSFGHVVNSVDKKAYLSAYGLANYIVVTCDSTSMISEAATSGKPIFVAHMNAKRNDYRFKKLFFVSN